MPLPDALANLRLALTPGGGDFFFTSPAFGLLLLVAMALLVAGGKRPNVRTAVVGAFSLFFYHRVVGWVSLPTLPQIELPFVAVLTLIALADWAIARQIDKTANLSGKRAWLWASLVVSLGTLIYFKYADFFTTTYYNLMGMPTAQTPGRVLLEVVGLSYFVFKSASYVQDVYYEEQPPERRFDRYLTYVAFFPNILAGPLHRAREILPELAKPYRLTRADLSAATFLFITGFFKKAVLADRLGTDFVDRVFDAPDRFTGFENLMASLGYGVQLYFDFSGYVDMALALALLLGFRGLTPNFREPFKAVSISDFWRRWHITLSQWFNDYLYTPLSFAWRRYKRTGAVVAVLITFILSGLWHGPAWAFVAWGASHGLAIGWETAAAPWRKRMATRYPVGFGILSRTLTLSYLAATWVLFKAGFYPDGLAHAGTVYAQIGGAFSSLSLIGAWFTAYAQVALTLAAALTLAFLPTAWKHHLKQTWARQPLLVQGLSLLIGFLLILQLAGAAMQPVIYLQF